MSAPPVDVTTPLSAAPHSLASLTDGEGQLTLSAFKALVRQALLLVRSGRTWPKSKTFNLEHDSRVDATKGASSCSGRLAKCGWHARSSLHSPGHSHSLKFHDFREGLAVDHAVKEQQYIHDIVLTDSLGKVQPPSALDGRLIKESRIELFHTGYNLPVLTGNRDFSQMFLTVEFKPVSKPMSDAHIDEILASLEGKGGQTSDEAAKAAVDNGLASFVNIQLPVKLDNCPEVPKEYVRAYYASVEMVRQTDDDGAEWWMAVQSDSSGRIPLMFQEMAMPSKVAPDVPLFIGWAKKDKEDKTSSNAV